MATYINNFLKSRKENLNNSENSFSDSYVGLFWFNNDYSDIIETKGEVKFDSKDVENGRTIIPDGTHASFKSKRFKTPRGRVELNNGILTISVGEKCPSDAIDHVINIMGLIEFKSSIVIRRNSFWDKK